MKPAGPTATCSADEPSCGDSAIACQLRPRDVVQAIAESREPLLPWTKPTATMVPSDSVMSVTVAPLGGSSASSSHEMPSADTKTRVSPEGTGHNAANPPDVSAKSCCPYHP